MEVPNSCTLTQLKPILSNVDDEVNENTHNSDEKFVDNPVSVTGYLSTVLKEELDGRNHKLIVTAVHAVMLDSGFVCFDGNFVNAVHFPSKWLCGLSEHVLFYILPEIVSFYTLSELSLIYTLPKIVSGEVVVLKFKGSRDYMYVSGELRNGSGKKKINTHRSVKLLKSGLVPSLMIAWENCGKDEKKLGNYMEKNVLGFWRIVKDNIARSLLIDLCVEAGLESELPLCFMQLPGELKLNILELVRGVDIAKASRVCSELCYLAKSDDMWKLKYVEEFGDEVKDGEGSWKKAFGVSWISRKIARIKCF